MNWRSVILMAGAMLSVTASSSEDFGTVGKLFEIEEPNLLHEMAGKLFAARDSGLIDEMNAEFAARVEAGVNRPPHVPWITRAVETRSWLWDPSIVVPQDFADHRGVVFAEEGTVINPLETMSLRKTYLFVDGDDDEQVEWAVERYQEAPGFVTVVLVKGEPLKLMELHQVRFFFDQKAVLSSKFGIQAVPASVWQEDVHIRISEYSELGPETGRRSDP